MHDIVVFLGPTLSHADAAKIVPALYLPPAAQGDVYHAHQTYLPRLIALVDGVFENTPAVWHKEILYCMAQGCHVLGASSMGALRAAELDSFGMVGIGQIYNAYRSGVIEDDDEVALVHGPAQIGYPPLTEAMVNIRATLQKALEDAVIAEKDYGLLLTAAKELHYKRRSYAALVRAAEDRLDRGTGERFFSWLQHGRKDQKKTDATTLLRYIKDMTAGPLERKKVTYKFETTQTWLAVAH